MPLGTKVPAWLHEALDHLVDPQTGQFGRSEAEAKPQALELDPRTTPNHGTWLCAACPARQRSHRCMIANMKVSVVRCFIGQGSLLCLSAIFLLGCQREDPPTYDDVVTATPTSAIESEECNLAMARFGLCQQNPSALPPGFDCEMLLAPCREPEEEETTDLGVTDLDNLVSEAENMPTPTREELIHRINVLEEELDRLRSQLQELDEASNN